MAAQVQTVAVGELTQPVLVNRAQQLGGFGIDGRVVEGHPRRRGGLVIADSGDLVQQTQRRMHRARAFRRQHKRRSEEHTSELQSLMRNPYAGFCLKKKKKTNKQTQYKERQLIKQDTQKFRTKKKKIQYIHPIILQQQHKTSVLYHKIQKSYNTNKSTNNLKHYKSSTTLTLT